MHIWGNQDSGHTNWQPILQRGTIWKLARKIEDDLSLLQQFPYLHWRIKWLTFCTNTRPHYFLGAVSPRTSTAIVHQLDKSVENLCAYTLHFPQDYAHSSIAQTISRLYDNTAWASAKAALDVFDSFYSAYFSALVHTICSILLPSWLKEHPIT